MQEALTVAQEAEVNELAEAIAQAASAEFQQLARALVCSGASPFGKTEFAVRDILLKAGAKAYEQFLAQKKTRTANLAGRPVPPTS
jgi:parvulin-like peptidyl-prolyl isomerase